jgi:hypothetical protein
MHFEEIVEAKEITAENPIKVQETAVFMRKCGRNWAGR